MFDIEETKGALDQRLEQRGFQSLAYRSLLVALIDGEGKVYGVDAAIKRVSALVKDTYREMLDKATDVGFSASFSMTLSDMATRANLQPGGGRDDLYLYLMKSTAKRGLDSLTAAQLEKGDVFDVTDVAPATYGFRVYANLSDRGVDRVRAQAAQLANISGVVAYKVAKPGARWRRDTMVVYCKTAAATGRVLAWFRGVAGRCGRPGDLLRRGRAALHQRRAWAAGGVCG